MPLYEYQCDACAHRFEVIQKFSDALIAVCPKCGGPVQKLLSSPAIQFKGSGFYLTDYGRGTGSKSEGGDAKATKADSGGKSGSDTKAESKSDSAKTESKGEGTKSGDAKTTTSETSSPKSAPAKSD